MIITDPWTMERDIYIRVLGYDLWIYLTFLIVPVLSITAHLHIRDELKKTTPVYNSNRFWLALQNVDYKFLLIPVAFIVLRMWSCINGILLDFMGMDPTKLPQGVSLTLMILARVREQLLCCCFPGSEESTTFPHLQETKKLLQGETKARPNHYVISQSIEKTPPVTD